MISFDPAHSPSNTSSLPLPRLDVSLLRDVWAGASGVNADVYAHANGFFTRLEFRAAGAYEGAPDLREPRFSSCSVPLVMW